MQNNDSRMVEIRDAPSVGERVELPTKVVREMHDDTEEKVKRIMNRKMDDQMAKVANELLEEFGSVKTVVKTMKERGQKRGKRG